MTGCNFVGDMKIDSKFFEERWVKAVGAEFGAQGVLAVIRLFCRVYESPGGYWCEMERLDRAVLAGEVGMTLEQIDSLIERLIEYGIVDEAKLRRDCVVTSKAIQREYIRNAGVAKARKLTWKTHCLLDLEELLELGIAPAIYGEESDEPYGEPIPIVPCQPTRYPGYRQVRLRHPDPKTRLYRVVRVKAEADRLGVEKKKCNFAT